MPVALRNSTTHPPGRGYRFELSIDPRFPEVPISPAFALIPSHVAVRSKAILRGTGCALPIRPPGRSVRLSHAIRSCRHFLRHAVSWSPNVLSPQPVALPRPVEPCVIGSKGGITPPSAQRSRTSLIGGMRLQRLLGRGFGDPRPAGLATRHGLAARVSLQLAVCPQRPSVQTLRANRRGVRVSPRLSSRLDGCPKAYSDVVGKIFGTSISVLTFVSITLHRSGIPIQGVLPA
jgi:hypothetical protein